MFRVPRPEDVRTFYSNAVEGKVFAVALAAARERRGGREAGPSDVGAIAVTDRSQIADPASVKMLEVEGL